MDEPVVDVMTSLLENVTTIITNFLSWFSTVCTSLIANPLVALMFGMGIAILIYKLVLKLVGKASFRSSRRRR